MFTLEVSWSYYMKKGTLKAIIRRAYIICWNDNLFFGRIIPYDNYTISDQWLAKIAIETNI